MEWQSYWELLLIGTLTVMAAVQLWKFMRTKKKRVRYFWIAVLTIVVGIAFYWLRKKKQEPIVIPQYDNQTSDSSSSWSSSSSSSDKIQQTTQEEIKVDTSITFDGPAKNDPHFMGDLKEWLFRGLQAKYKKAFWRYRKAQTDQRITTERNWYSHSSDHTSIKLFFHYYNYDRTMYLWYLIMKYWDKFSSAKDIDLFIKNFVFGKTTYQKETELDYLVKQLEQFEPLNLTRKGYFAYLDNMPIPEKEKKEIVESSKHWRDGENRALHFLAKDMDFCDSFAENLGKYVTDWTKKNNNGKLHAGVMIHQLQHKISCLPSIFILLANKDKPFTWRSYVDLEKADKNKFWLQFKINGKQLLDDYDGILFETTDLGNVHKPFDSELIRLKKGLEIFVTKNINYYEKETLWALLLKRIKEWEDECNLQINDDLIKLIAKFRGVEIMKQFDATRVFTDSTVMSKSLKVDTFEQYLRDLNDFVGYLVAKNWNTFTCARDIDLFIHSIVCDKKRPELKIATRRMARLEPDLDRILDNEDLDDVFFWLDETPTDEEKEKYRDYAKQWIDGENRTLLYFAEQIRGVSTTIVTDMDKKRWTQNVLPFVHNKIRYLPMLYILLENRDKPFHYDDQKRIFLERAEKLLELVTWSNSMDNDQYLDENDYLLFKIIV